VKKGSRKTYRLEQVYYVASGNGTRRNTPVPPINFKVKKAAKKTGVKLSCYIESVNSKCQQIVKLFLQVVNNFFV